jgi:hypothetical protein
VKRLDAVEPISATWSVTKLGGRMANLVTWSVPTAAGVAWWLSSPSLVASGSPAPDVIPASIAREIRVNL